MQSKCYCSVNFVMIAFNVQGFIVIVANLMEYKVTSITLFDLTIIAQTLNVKLVTQPYAQPNRFHKSTQLSDLCHFPFSSGFTLIYSKTASTIKHQKSIDYNARPSSSRSHITSPVDIIFQQYFLSSERGAHKKQTFLVVRVVFSINGHEQFITDNIPLIDPCPFILLGMRVGVGNKRQPTDEASLRGSFVSSKSLMEKITSNHSRYGEKVITRNSFVRR